MIPITFPLKFSYDQLYYKDYVDNFFASKQNYWGSWKGNKKEAPNLQRFTSEFKQQATLNFQHLKKISIRGNLSPEEKQILKEFLNLKNELGFNVSDKNFGPVIYSRSKLEEQDKLHLYDSCKTYQEITMSNDEIYSILNSKLLALISKYNKPRSPLSSICKQILNWAKLCSIKKKLGNFYSLFKLHKPPNKNGCCSRPIANTKNFITSEASHKLHELLQEDIYNQPSILKDSLSMIRKLHKIDLTPYSTLLIATADVTALYPSIDIERGLIALLWFLNTHTKHTQLVKTFIMDLARFILENNYVECKLSNIPHIFLQLIGTAMGTNFAVIYANALLLYIEEPIIKEYKQYIVLYDRFIDDIHIMWSGSKSLFAEFQNKINHSDPSIKLIWSLNPTEDSMDEEKDLMKAGLNTNFLDINILLSKTDSNYRLSYSTFRKPGSSYAYLPHSSFHQKHTFAAWIKAELLRLLTHSSSLEIWIKDCNFFYKQLKSRGYPSCFLIDTFTGIKWSQKDTYIFPSPETIAEKRRKKEQFFDKYKACTLPIRYTPTTVNICRNISLKLDQLREGAPNNIFPIALFKASINSKNLGAILHR
jgi:hypothetical protein